MGMEERTDENIVQVSVEYFFFTYLVVFPPHVAGGVMSIDENTWIRESTAAILNRRPFNEDEAFKPTMA